MLWKNYEKLRLFLHGADSKQSGNITIQFRHANHNFLISKYCVWKRRRINTISFFLILLFLKLVWLTSLPIKKYPWFVDIMKQPFYTGNVFGSVLVRKLNISFKTRYQDENLRGIKRGIIKSVTQKSFLILT